MLKRGQVTVFIIVGIIILAIAAGIFYFVNKTMEEKLAAEEEKALPPDLAPVKIFVEQCLEKTLEEALVAVGKQGGYFILPELSTTKAYRNAPYYVYQGEDNVPSLETLQSEVSSYLEEQFPFCVQNFQAFPYLIEFEEPEAQTNIVKSKVKAQLLFPLKITIGESTTTLDLFSSSVDSRLLQIYEASQELTDLSLEYGTGICLDCVAELSEENNLDIDIVEFKDDEIFYVIKDEQVKILDQPYYFRFANKYDLSEELILPFGEVDSEELLLPLQIQ